MKKIAFFIVMCLSLNTLAQTNIPYTNEIEAFKHADAKQMPPQQAVLFIGSSSFTMWKDISSYFPKHKIINRAFGGSTLLHQLQYVNTIVFPYNPQKIVIYCGENDIAYGGTGKQTAERFECLFFIIRESLPKVPIIYVSIKPSPSRAAMMTEMEIGNALIKGFLSKQTNTHYVDVYNKMLDNNGMPDTTLFINDMLHLNSKGYALWKHAIELALRKHE